MDLLHTLGPSWNPQSGQHRPFVYPRPHRHVPTPSPKTSICLQKQMRLEELDICRGGIAQDVCVHHLGGASVDLELLKAPGC